MKRTDVEDLAATIGRLLGAIEAGSLDATPADRERLVGALVALRIVLGEPSDDVIEAIRSGKNGLDA